MGGGSGHNPWKVRIAAPSPPAVSPPNQRLGNRPTGEHVRTAGSTDRQPLWQPSPPPVSPGNPLPGEVVTCRGLAHMFLWWTPGPAPPPTRSTRPCQRHPLICARKSVEHSNKSRRDEKAGGGTYCTSRYLPSTVPEARLHKAPPSASNRQCHVLHLCAPPPPACQRGFAIHRRARTLPSTTKPHLQFKSMDFTPEH